MARVTKNFIEILKPDATPTALLSKDIIRMKTELSEMRIRNKNELDDISKRIVSISNMLSDIDNVVNEEIQEILKYLKQDGNMNLGKIKEEWHKELQNLKTEFQETLYQEVQAQSEKVKSERTKLIALYKEILDTMQKAHLKTKTLVISDVDFNRYTAESLTKSFKKIQSDLSGRINEIDRLYNQGKNSLDSMEDGEMFKTPMLEFLSSTKSLFNLDKKNKEFIDNVELVLNKMRLIVNQKIINLDELDEVTKHNEIVDKFEAIKNKINEKYSKILRDSENELKESILSESSETRARDHKGTKITRLKNELKLSEDNYDEKQKLFSEEEEVIQYKISMAEDAISRSRKIIDFDDNKIIELENRVKKLSSLVMGRKRYEMLKSMNIMDLDIEVNPEDNDATLLLRAEEKMKQNLEKYSSDKEVMKYTLEEHRERLYNAQREIDPYFIMNSSYKLGVKKYKEELTDEDFILKTQNRSIAVVYKPDMLRETINLVKYMLMQTMNDYHPSTMRINILNSGFNMDFNNAQVITDRVDPNTGKKTKGRVYAQSFSIEEDIVEISQNQRKILNQMQKGGLLSQDFHEMLSDKRLRGAMMEQYTINVILNTSSKEDFRVFSSQSDITGITNIEFFNYNELQEIGDDNKPKLTQEGKAILDNYTIVIEPTAVKDIQDKGKVLDVTVLDTKAEILETIAYPLTKESDFAVWGKKLQTRYFEIPKTGYTTEDYIEKHCQEFFSASAEVGVQLHFGPKDGDMSTPGFIMLDGDSDNVHLFIAGTTGGGKSNTLAVMLNMLKVMYPPSQLSVIYFDFKIVEVMLHAKPYKMPHCVAMCGTECGDYIKSLMEYVVEDMNYRMEYFKQWGTLNLKDCRKLVLKEIDKLQKEGKIKEAMQLKKSLPTRTILLVDEAAQAYQMEESVREVFSKSTIKLSQLARAAGIHMVYVSQDPSRMPDEVMNNFKMRACTKANKEVSQMVLKNDFASWPEHDVLGFFCSNGNGGDPEYNVKYMVPFNDAEFSTPIFSKIALELTKERGEVNRQPVIFDQDELLLPFKFKNLEEQVGPPTFELKRKEVYLGEPVKFITKPEMSSITLFRDAKQHITIVTPAVKMKENLIRRLYEGMQDENLTTFVAFLKDKPFWFSYENCFGVSEDDFLESGNVVMDKEDLKESSLVDGVIALAGLEMSSGEKYDDDGNIIEEDEDEKERSEEDTTLIFVFDSDIVDYRGGYSQGELMQIFSEASSKGVHVIFIESGPGRTIGEPYVNYVLASGVTDSEFPRVIRDVGKVFVKKWVKEGEGTETFKPLYYN